MRLLRFRPDADVHDDRGVPPAGIGLAGSAGVVELSGRDPVGAGRPIATLGHALADALAAPDAFAELEHGPADHSWDDIALAVPADPGARMLCAGANYHKKYPLGGNVQAPPQPVYFNKPPGTLVADGEELVRPVVSEQLDYEVELAVVIGRAGRHISTDDALRHVGGYTVLNDGSVRNWQRHSVAAGKNFYRSGSMGPWICTADEIEDPASLEVICRVNGEERQRASVSEMIFTVAEVITYLSRVMPLEPGDIIATGSPEGAGGSHDPPKWLMPGDRVEFEIPGVGVLSNPVADETVTDR